ncbi:hypothetical protein MMC14_002719 [Varicellaria rhodocarpa]|nr:hypothetical protein [Varicellaria rhodocarpa]
MSPIQVLFLIYPKFNTLDLNGPLEVLRSAAYLESMPFATTIAADELTTAAEGITVKPDISFAEALDKITKWHILIVIGAPTKDVMAVVQKIQAADKGDDKGVGQVVNAFMSLGAFPDGKERVMMSICTGALILGALGVFDGFSATTHHMALPSLKMLCMEYKANNKGTAHGTKVVRQRYVDAGWNEKGTRIISSGGVSSGIDATIYLVKEKLGRETADNVAKMMEYAWREVKELEEVDYVLRKPKQQ